MKQPSAPCNHVRRFMVISLVLVLVAAACGSDNELGDAADGGTPTGDAMDDAMDMDGGDGHAEEYEFGRPAAASDASRVIEILADEFTFTPATVTVTQGETVTFRVVNTGVVAHDLTLGDSHMQDEHEAEMAEMAGDAAMHDEPNAFVLAVGETNEMTWQMTQEGEILYGCHQPGHYTAGMVGTITIES